MTRTPIAAASSFRVTVGSVLLVTLECHHGATEKTSHFADARPSRVARFRFWGRIGAVLTAIYFPRVRPKPALGCVSVQIIALRFDYSGFD
jgi:hypothetical protein